MLPLRSERRERDMKEVTEERTNPVKVSLTVSAPAKSELVDANAPKSQKDIYMERIKRLAGEGLLDVKFYPANTVGVSEECAYAELNRLHSAADLPDKDVLGKYSP